MVVQPAPGGDKTQIQVRRGASGIASTLLWFRGSQPGPLQSGHIAHPWDTHAQKSSTVLNLVTRRRFACHILLLSFLKNHSAHLGREGRWGEFSHARAPLQLQHPHPSTGRGCPHLSPHTCSAGGACSGSLAGAALAVEPSVASAAPLASAGEGETAPRSPMATPAGQVGTPSSLPHTMTGTPQPGALGG